MNLESLCKIIPEFDKICDTILKKNVILDIGKDKNYK